MRIIVIGASGQLGSALVEELQTHTVVTPAHAEFDIERDDIAAFLDANPCDVLINCAAFHNVDACEREPDRAIAVNALVVDRLAGECARRNITFCTVSTDYVFDGFGGRPYTEADAPNPLSAYGVSKLAGELLVRRHGGAHIIVRTSGVYGRSGTSNKGYTFIERILQQAEAKTPIRVVTNMTFSPSYAPDVARVIRSIIEQRAVGTFHVTNTGLTTWFDFAQAALTRYGLEQPIEPVTYDGFGSAVKRPLYSPLASTALGAAGIASAPSWQSGLERFLEARRIRTGVGAAATREGKESNIKLM